MLDSRASSSLMVFAPCVFVQFFALFLESQKALLESKLCVMHASLVLGCASKRGQKKYR